MKPGAPRAPNAKDSNVRTENEVVYPFGVQNDLGHVVLTRNSKSSREDGRGDGCPGPPPAPPPLPPVPYTPPPHSTPMPPLSPLSCLPSHHEPELLSPRVLTASVSHLSLQSSRHNSSLASSLSDLSYDAAVLERALRTNDVAKVKKCFEKHRNRFQLLDRGNEGAEVATSSGAAGGQGPAQPGPSPQAKPSRTSEITTEPEESPVVFANALHLAVEWGANDVIRYLLRESVDPNRGGRLPDAYDMSVAGSRSASVSAWGSGCVFCPPSPRNISRDVSPSRNQDIGRIFSRNSSRNVSSESSRCVSPCRDRLWSTNKTDENRSAHLRREAFKNLSARCDEGKESSNNGDHDTLAPSEVRPIISVVYCTSDERRRSSTGKPPGEIFLPGSSSVSGNDNQDEWAQGGATRRMNRRVSWVSSLREPVDKNRMTLAGRLRKQKLRLPRQRSFSLESELELRTVAKRAVGVAGALASIREARRSISLKSSPLHFPWHFRRESSSAMRDGGVFAELRRSSEIFRNILLSIAGREESTPTDEEQFDLEKDLSFSSLLAAHGRRRSERSVSYSSCSWSDVSIGSESVPRKPLSINPAINKGLLVVAIEPRGREITFLEHYTSAHLMTLPPLFLASCRGRSTPVALLLQFGAKPTIPDPLGNTPLHLAVIQSPTPWDPILDLMESGGKIGVRNERGISPLDLLAPLGRLQKQLVADCWLGLVLEDAAHVMSEHADQATRETASRSSRLFKKLHEARHHREKGEGRGAAQKTPQKPTMTMGADQTIMPEMLSGNEGPASAGAIPGPSQRTPKNDEGNESRKNKLRRRKDKGSKPHIEADPGRLEWSELSRCLLTLKSVSANDECLDEVLHGLVLHGPSLLKRFQQVPPTTDVPTDPHQSLSGLLHTLITVGVQCHTTREDPKKYLSAVMCVVCKSCLLFSTGPHPLQYTAMVAMNKIIDISTVFRLTKESREIDGEKAAGSNTLQTPAPEVGPKGPCSTSTSKLGRGPFAKSKSKDIASKSSGLSSNQDLLEILEPAVGPIVNILHNAVTLYKRTIGSRQICTPSVRRRSCSAHCLQLLSARLLVFLVHAPAVQKSLVSEAPLRIFIAALDATHDPQLLCLVLQILATLALEPTHHKTLLDAGVAEALPPLLLPADEFFYTNHTTLFARYVKHHAARLLVYLGLHHRSALRVSVFDLLTADESTVQSGMLGNEDLFITWTCSTPPPVLGHSAHVRGAEGVGGGAGLPAVIAMSVESTLIRVLKSLEVSVAPGSPYLREPSSTSWLNQSPNRNCFSPALHYRRHSAETGRRDSIGGPELDPAFVRIFQTCYSSVVHPTILLRLLLHRLLSTGLALRRWKSCASRASFASAYSGHSGHSVFSMLSGESRTSRSRASSTDESIPLRRRRQVSLTVDCGVGSNFIGEGEESLILHELEENASPEPVQPSPTKKTTLRGIFNKWRSSSQEASVDKGEESQRLTAESGTKQRESSIFGLLPLAGLRAAVSRESLQGGSGPNSGNNSPTASPSFLAKQSFRFGSLHQRKSRRLSRNRSLDVSTEVTSPKDTPEDEIIAFQRRLQNLPDFLDTSIEPPSPPAIPPASPRPRSRSVPKVTLEAPLPYNLPGLGASSPPSSPTLPVPPPAQHLLSPSSPIRHCPVSLPQPIPPSPTSPGFLTPHSPKAVSRGCTPFDDKLSVSGSNHDRNELNLSRRSSVSPVSSITRRNDSIFISDMPTVHRAVLMFVEDWITTCRPHGKNSVIRELKDFVARVSSCGPPYLRWADHIRMLCPSLVSEEDVNELESLEAIETEYWEMQRLVVSGSLPCSKEEASVLAGIQLRLEECWPRSRPPPVRASANAVASTNLGFMPSTAPHTPSLNADRSSARTDDEKDTSLAPLVGESPGHHGRSEAYPRDGASYSYPGEEHFPEEIVSSKKTGMGRAVSLLTTCYSSSDDNEMSLSASTKIEELVPPYYVHAGNMHRLIKEQKRKLFHTSVYESATQLQKLYVQSCRRLPAYGCRLVVVKELLRGKTKKKATRLLGIGPEKIILLDCRTKVLARSQVTPDLIQWRAGGGRNHDRLILEFRSTKWSLLVPPVGSGSSCGVSCGHLGTVGGLREAGRALWALLREMDTHFLDDFAFPRRQAPPESDASKKRWKIKATVSPELEQLEKVLHFPEEVALALAETESQLYCQVAPLEYLRHVTMDLGVVESPPADPSQPIVGVNALIDRFNEISSWITHLLVSPPSHEERKAMLSCLLRVARTAWNLGAFGTAVEIIAGLKSSKLKPFWLSLHEKEDVVPTLDILTKALLGDKIGIGGVETNGGEDLDWCAPDYEAALERTLKILTCPVVPFFGAYLKELRTILNTPSLVVLTSGSEVSLLQTLLNPSTEGEDEFFTKIGPGGLLNMNKLRKVQAVLEKISLVHHHHSKRQQRAAFLHADRLSIHTSSIERAGFPDEEEGQQEVNDELFGGGTDLMDEVAASSSIYQPVQGLSHDHSVSFIPLDNSKNSIDLHVLQVLHHGSTALHIDSDGRSAFVWVKLERSCGTITWSKPVWSSLRFSHTQPDFLLSVDPELIPVLPGLVIKYGSGYGSGGVGTGSSGPTGFGGAPDVAGIGIEEGYIDLNGVKEVESGSREVDISAAMKRYGIESWSTAETCVSLVYGVVLSDNRSTVFVFPPRLATTWLSGLRAVVKSLRRVIGKPDRRLFWLKEQYLQLYFEDGRCLAPTMADSIRVFGGRRWSSSAPQGSQPETPPFRRTASAKFRKKRSLANIHTLKDNFIRGPEHPPGELYRPPSPATRPRTEMGEGSTPPTPPHQPQSLTRIKSAMSMVPGPSSEGSPSPQARVSVLTHETRLSFQNFVSLFQAFSLRSRKDLRDLFDSIATVQKSEGTTDSSQPGSPDRSHSSSASGTTPRHGTKTTSGSSKTESKFIYDAIASASIVQNGAGVETSRGRILTLQSFASFLKVQQGERKSEAEIIAIADKYEPDELLRSQHSLSFEGFARYMMSAHNLAFVSERIMPQEAELDHPLTHYYIAASHNTYLTGHQLKGESSVELYSQVLLTGCRCVELDCWDGDDGDPVIYHGHTFTTKIPFRQVVDAINKSAFLASSYPVILSIENHCSLQQQARMAWTFQTIFGEKLVTRFLFDVDFTDDPCLPSPAQLKNRILIKNKKIHAEIIPNPVIHPSATSATSAVNPPVRNRSGSRPQSARTNSIVSNVSGGSMNDEYSDDDVESDYEDDIPDERLVVSRQASEQALPITPRTDSLTSQESSLKSGKRTGTVNVPTLANQCQSEQGEWIVELEESVPKTKKQSSQIARELSDLVIYLQAIKFRGLTTLSPSSSVRNKIMQKKSILPAVNPPTSLPVTPTSSNISTGADHHPRRVISNHPVYQCCSLNENASKKLCRKQPLQVLAHTETQLIRAYPAGMRIDSSNFNPLIFWAFGIQMVALNYQTEDAALHMNAAMFEQNGRCGYVLKPAVMWDRNHVMYRRFNPLEKEFDGLHTVHLHLTIVSGQFLSPTNYQASPQVEVEVSGIPADCAKLKTRILPRNALNPIWNEMLSFTIQFRELAFVRFTVLEGGSGGSSGGHILAQRVIPLKGLRQGYRHLRLRNVHNHPLPVTTLFIHSRLEEEGEEMNVTNGQKHFCKDDSFREGTPTLEGTPLMGISPAKASVALKRRMFFLVVHGVVADEPYTILKVTQDTTAAEVINNALQKSGRTAESAREYVLIEEVARGWDAKEKDLPPTQRVLDSHEKPLQSQSHWKGDGKFILKRTGNDPSSRAWLSSISARGSRFTDGSRGDKASRDSDELQHWGEDDNFLVCVHNVSTDIPYAILKVPVKSTAQDIIAQAFVKARRLEDPAKFVLVEELEPLIASTSSAGTSEAAGSFRKKSSQRATHRVLLDDENVYEVQLKWNNLGRFVLRERKQAHALCGSSASSSHSSGGASSSDRPKPGRGIRAATLARLTKLKIHRNGNSKAQQQREKARQYLTERQALSLHDTTTQSTRPRKAKRDVHSEGETLTDEELQPDSDFKATVARLKKVSLRKFRAWKS